MTINELQNTISAFQKSRIILTAFELDIFTTLADKELTLCEIKQKTGYDKRALEILLNALCSIDIIKKVNSKYSNTETGSEFLVKDKPQYMSNLHHTNSLWHTWSNITEIVKHGNDALNPISQKNDIAWIENFIEAMHRRAIVQAPKTAEYINLDNVKFMLDIGGGSGAFCMAFIEKNPIIKATVFDLPAVLPVTNKYIEKEGYKGRISTYAGDYHSDKFPGNNDLVLLSAIIHMNSLDENKDLIKKCAQSMNKEAQLVISDFVLNDQKTGPERAAMFAVNMLAGTKSGNTFSLPEIKEMLDFAGLKFQKSIDTDFKGTIIIATK